MAEGKPVDQQSLRKHYEVHDLPVGKVTLAAVGLAVVLIATFAGVALELSWFGSSRTGRPPIGREATALAPPEGTPRLQADPAGEGIAIDEAALRRLHTLGWEDRPAQRVHIPIGQAIDRLARQGWPYPDQQTAGGPTDVR